MFPTLKKLCINATVCILFHIHFISDKVSLPEINKSVKCLSMCWPRDCYFTRASIVKYSDPVGDGKLLPIIS